MKKKIIFRIKVKNNKVKVWNPNYPIVKRNIVGNNKSKKITLIIVMNLNSKWIRKKIKKKLKKIRHLIIYKLKNSM